MKKTANAGLKKSNRRGAEGAGKEILCNSCKVLLF